jgi:putative membrane protein
MKLVIRWLIIIMALFVAEWLLVDIRVEGTEGWIAFSVMAVVLAFANAIIRPLLVFFSCGCILLTMGLFMLVVNALTLWISSYISVNWLGIGFYVDGFWPAFWGSIIISVVSYVLSMVLLDKRERTRR